MMRRLIAGIMLAASLANVCSVETSDAEIMAKCLWGECRGAKTTMEKAAVAWCILNRVDSDTHPDTIAGVITQPSQFTGYRKSNPIDPELLLLSRDVIDRWIREQSGETDVGRVLPSDYLYFVGHGGHNHFSTTWPVSTTWDWSLENPYKEENNADTFDGMDEHDEPADALDRNHARLLRVYRSFDDGVVD